MTQQIDLEKYQEFVQGLTSKESNNLEDLIIRLQQLQQENIVNPSLLLTGALGLSSESGELVEIVKKVLFQGKPLTEDTKFHLKRELGDIIWYWINACRALSLYPNDVIQENVNKLSARYPEGCSVHYSENRKQGDL